MSVRAESPVGERVTRRVEAGAHGRHRRSGHVRHRAHPARPRRAGVGLRRQGVARRRGASRAGRGDPYRPRRVLARPAARGADRGGDYPCGDPEDEPRTGRGQAARHSGHFASGGAGQVDGRVHHVDGDRDTRQDHDDVDAHCRLAAQRFRSLLRRRRRSRRGRNQRAPRQWRLLRRRGRRKRRLTARIHAECRGGDQHRGRSSRLLRQRRGLRRGVRRLRRAAGARGSAGGLHRRPRRRSTRRKDCGTGHPGAALRERRPA